MKWSSEEMYEGRLLAAEEVAGAMLDDLPCCSSLTPPGATWKNKGRGRGESSEPWRGGGDHEVREPTCLHRHPLGEQ